MPGPVPKRSNQRRRRPSNLNRPQSVQAAGEVVVPPADEAWHPIARDWYDSLALSAQSQFYEPSDWAYARIWAEVLSRQLESRFSARLMGTWQTAANDLLTTEASRRRVRLEVERRSLASVPAPTSLDDFRDL